MSDELRIKYGGRDVSLTKSDQLVAVKPRMGAERQLRAAMESLPSANAATGQTLGGFQIIRIDESARETDRQLDLLRLNPSVAAGSHVFHTSNDEVPFVPTGSLYVVFKPETSQAQIESTLSEASLQLQEARTAHELIVRVTSDSANPVKVAAQLQASPLIETAEPELATPSMLKQFQPPQDSLLREQWHLQNTGFHRGTNVGFTAGADARVVEAWAKAGSLGSPDVIVAVIDDGFDLSHPDFAADGKIVKPWDFQRNSDSPLPSAGTQDWHGTACAGVAVGHAGGGNIVGVAPGSRLMPVRFGPSLSDTQIERWFDYVRREGAWVVSCSWGAEASYFPLSTRMKNAIARCATDGRNGKGCVIVFAAGNANHDIDDPSAGTLDGFAIHPNVIAVAASNSKDQKSSYSNFGARICVCAPSSGAGGWGILTSDVTGMTSVNGATAFLGYDDGDYTYDFGGTSSACPLVAGVCALMLSVDPGLTAENVRVILKSSARKIGDPASYVNGHSVFFGAGCVNALAAIGTIIGDQNVTTPVTFAKDIRPLFRPKDVSSMKSFGGFDLSKYEDVVSHAEGILARLVDGSMPCDARWDSARIDLFRSWIQGGKTA